MPNICPNCFKTGFTERCALCGYTEQDYGNNQMLLSPGTVINNRYTVGRVLGAGGFGVTYLVMDNSTGTRMAIKEYLPTDFVVRDGTSKHVYPSSSENAGLYDHGLKVFDQEAESLRLFLGNPSIVQVIDNFHQFGTSYYVMEFLDGVNLKTLASSMGGKLSVTLALEVLQCVGSALEEIHERGLLHRDISPANIFVTKQGMIKLIDFGATRFFLGERSRNFTVVLNPGFTPPEQYSSNGKQGPWTDIYALSATILCVVSGVSLPAAPERLSGTTLDAVFSSAGLEPGLRRTLEKSLELDYRERFQTANDFLTYNTSSHTNVSSTGSGSPVSSLSMQSRASGLPFVRLMQGDRWLIPANIDIKIGRTKDRCNIILSDKGVSRIHCVIRFDSRKGVFILTDLSSNGTYLKNGRMKHNVPQLLMPGDRFVMPGGKSELEVGVK